MPEPQAPAPTPDDDGAYPTVAASLGRMAREAEQPALLPDRLDRPFGTFITTDGRPVTLHISERVELTLNIGGRGNPVTLDRWQTLAMLEALAECR